MGDDFLKKGLGDSAILIANFVPLSALFIAPAYLCLSLWDAYFFVEFLGNSGPFWGSLFAYKFDEELIFLNMWKVTSLLHSLLLTA